MKHKDQRPPNKPCVDCGQYVVFGARRGNICLDCLIIRMAKALAPTKRTKFLKGVFKPDPKAPEKPPEAPKVADTKAPEGPKDQGQGGNRGSMLPAKPLKVEKADLSPCPECGGKMEGTAIDGVVVAVCSKCGIRLKI